MNPAGSQLTAAVLAEFLRHQARLLQLVAAAKGTDLNHKAVRIEFFKLLKLLKLLKLRVGEALQFVVAHEQRHVYQALRAAKEALTQETAAVLVV